MYSYLHAIAEPLKGDPYASLVVFGICIAAIVLGFVIACVVVYWPGERVDAGFYAPPRRRRPADRAEPCEHFEGDVP